MLVRVVEREANRRATDAGLVPLRIMPQDLVTVGAMKSGNTWFRFLVAGAVFGVDIRYAPPRLVYSLIPNPRRDPYVVRYGPVAFFRSHELPRPEFRRVVYLLRDGRDVMVSMYHHLQATRGEGNVDFLRMVREGEGLYPSKWSEHVRAWKANPYDAEILTIRYEDLLENGVKEMQRLCEFVGIERDPSVLEAAVTNARFEEMRGLQGRFGAVNDAKWRPEKAFVRRGQSGSFRDEMPREVLEAFMAEAGPVLAEVGYTR
jgi:Sulfotransferase domain